MIDQIVPFSVAAAAAAVNFAPTNFNPIPADGFITIWGCTDSSAAAANQPPTLTVTLGGATPFTPVPGTSVRVNSQGIVGAGPSETDLVMPRQAVRQGTNLQALLAGGTGQTFTGRLRFKFVSMEEAVGSAGALVS